MATNYNQLFAIMEKNKQKILSVCPNANEKSGIYIMTREENGFKYCYVGQARHILTRLSQHLSGYQHIDLSLKSHKLYSETNKTGWKIGCLFYPLDQLNEMEQYYIKLYANNGYQMRNKTSGSQGVGKQGISENKPSKGYHDGVAYGEKKAKKKVKEFFDKYLDYQIKEPKNKIKERKLGEFAEFLRENNESGN